MAASMAGRGAVVGWQRWLDGHGSVQGMADLRGRPSAPLSSLLPRPHGGSGGGGLRGGHGGRIRAGAGAAEAGMDRWRSTLLHGAAMVPDYENLE